MIAEYALALSLDEDGRAAELRLTKPDGSHGGYQRVEFAKLEASKLDALFDLRNHLRRLYAPQDRTAALAALGVVIAEKLFGPEIFDALWKPLNQRSLKIVLPAPDRPGASLAAALARVPWEIARPAASAKTLTEKALVVRLVPETPPTPTETLPIEDSLRVLVVFAAARESKPLAMRAERKALRKLFEEQVYPHRKVEVDLLAHGVTHERLVAQIRSRAGYHVVHWSGHGHMNLLELARPGGELDRLSGEALLALFAEAGGYIPGLIVLSACHSGDIADIKDWDAFVRAVRARETGVREAPAADPLAERPGFAGTAHALIAGGVPSVVAMRYSVGDEYARDLGLEFYRGLFADKAPKSAAEALTLARNALGDPKRDQRFFDACDHATPILYGDGAPKLKPPPGRSEAYAARERRLHRIAELTIAEHSAFVGRAWELAGLEAEVFGIGAEGPVKPIGLVTGLGGMGKTALVAEALDLWETKFDWLLAYQAKPNSLSFELFLADVDRSLRERLGRYHDHVRANPGDAIFIAPREDFKGERRYGQLIGNLVRAMRDEAILVVLDNFETNLTPAPDSEGASACQDPAWDACLSRLADELGDTRSRVLITCRRPIAALSGKPCHHLRLGPLSVGEALLYLTGQPALRAMVAAGGAEGELAKRLLTASRLHPLLMDRLARLTAAEHRETLMKAIEALEQGAAHAGLPGLFAEAIGKEAQTRELAYLEDALGTSIDQLLESVGPDARRLLWTIAHANEPITIALLGSVWSGENWETEKRRRLKAARDDPSSQPLETREILERAIDEQVDASPPPPGRPDIAPSLRRLEQVGLVDLERASPDESHENVSCHAVIRDRILRWMEDRPSDLGSMSADAARLGYADRLRYVAESSEDENPALALEAGARAVAYYVQAGDTEVVSVLAGRLLALAGASMAERLMPVLETATRLSREGRDRWRSLGNLANALHNVGRSTQSLPLFGNALALARAALDESPRDAAAVWSDLAVITLHEANALQATGRLQEAIAAFAESARAFRKAGRPEADALDAEVSALVLRSLTGDPQKALPRILATAEKVTAWWRKCELGARLREAPDRQQLGSLLVTTRGAARDAYAALRKFDKALAQAEEAYAVTLALRGPPESIATTRFGRAVILVELGRFAAAKQELDAVYDAFASNPDKRAAVLSTMAALYRAAGDFDQAIAQERRALAVRETIPDPEDRIISHTNLSNHLLRAGREADWQEMIKHRLADLSYRLATGFRLQNALTNCTAVFQLGRVSGWIVSFPNLTELLADPAFVALKLWLTEHHVDGGELQSKIDSVLASARKTAN